MSTRDKAVRLLGLALEEIAMGGPGMSETFLARLVADGKQACVEAGIDPKDAATAAGNALTTRYPSLGANVDRALPLLDQQLCVESAQG
jgi:hypothetical protein